MRAGDLEVWVDQVGDGPDTLLIGGAGEAVESWQFQLDGLADRYRLTARRSDGDYPHGPPGVLAVKEVGGEEALADLSDEAGACGIGGPAAAAEGPVPAAQTEL